MAGPWVVFVVILLFVVTQVAVSPTAQLYNEDRLHRFVTHNTIDDIVGKFRTAVIVVPTQ